MKSTEAAHLNGSRAVYRELLGVALRGLIDDGSNLSRERLVIERSEALATIRRLCEETGASTEWPDNLHLADIIEKHLMRR